MGLERHSSVLFAFSLELSACKENTFWSVPITVNFKKAPSSSEFSTEMNTV